MAHKTGAAFHEGSMKDRHLPHGCANAIYLPYVIKYNAHDGRAAERYADIARMLGLPGNSNKGLIENLCALIDKMNDELNIPHTLKEFGVDEAEFNAKVLTPAQLTPPLWLSYSNAPTTVLRWIFKSI